MAIKAFLNFTLVDCIIVNAPFDASNFALTTLDGLKVLAYDMPDGERCTVDVDTELTGITGTLIGRISDILPAAYEPLVHKVDSQGADNYTGALLNFYRDYLNDSPIRIQYTPDQSFFSAINKEGTFQANGNLVIIQAS